MEITAQHQKEQPGKEYLMDPAPKIIRENYKGSEKLKNKVALITGGDSGIGRAIAVHFAREGADIAIVYKEEEQKDAKETARMIEAEGRKCILITIDLRDPESATSVVEKTINEFGKINILVNNAAEQFPKERLEEISYEQLLDTFKTNIFPHFMVSKAALKHMNKGDSIINTASVNAYRGNPELMDYSSTKGAIVSFTRSLALNLAEKNIRVNAVAPGPVWTPLIPATFPEDKVKEFGKQVPLKRPGQPAEIAPCFVFLASEDASYMTGQVLHPNGGEVINT
jgi:NAD(P)-dependent dehydrogenase (short-subunit alcohol dehydrogenase family)